MAELYNPPLQVIQFIGTRAGDVMTKITVGVFVVWIVLCLTLIVLMTQSSPYTGGAQAGKSLEAPEKGAPESFGESKGAADVPLPPPVEKAAGAATAPEKKEAAPKAESKPEAAKEAPKSAPADAKNQPASKPAEPATKKAEPAAGKQG